MEPVVAAYKAAGVFPIRKSSTTGEVEVLLALEAMEGTARCKYYATPGGCTRESKCEFLHTTSPSETADELPRLRLNFLGGRRATDETAMETAARKWFQETGGLVSHNEAASFLDQEKSPDTKVLRVHGAYDLYVGNFGPSLNQAIVEDFSNAGHHPPEVWATELKWVPVKSLLEIRSDPIIGLHISFTETEVPVQYAVSYTVWSLAERYPAVLAELVDVTKVSTEPLNDEKSVELFE